MHNSLSAARRPQAGAILVTSLLLLLILTVLGVAMMKMTNMQERMAGNTRDLNLALQGAEAALRAGETAITALPARPNLASTLPCVFCEPFVLPVNLDDPSVFDWSANAVAVPVAGLTNDPAYTIEEAGVDRDSLVVDEPGARVFYTVTSRSTGASGQANTVLQSTFARRFE